MFSTHLIYFSQVLKFCLVGWMLVAHEVLLCLSSLVQMEKKLKSWHLGGCPQLNQPT